MMRSPNPNRVKITTPKKNSRPAIHDFAEARLRLVSTTAPRNAVTAPGTATRTSTLVSTLPTLQCDRPLTNVVGSLAAWVAAEAAAGAMPMRSSTVADVTPKPMPSVPSTIWARPPATANARTSPTVTPIRLLSYC